MLTISLVDYGVGNLHSLKKALEKDPSLSLAATGLAELALMGAVFKIVRSHRHADAAALRPVGTHPRRNAVRKRQQQAFCALRVGDVRI